jgi:succinyl-CoA synthetase alpha subunit
VRLLEHEAKQILRARGFEIPRGALVRTVDEIEYALMAVPLPAMVKAQVPVGGRGKAGGVFRVADPPAVREAVSRLLTSEVCGLPVEGVLLEAALPVQRELYMGFTYDPVAKEAILLASAEGGVDIEARSRGPGQVVRRALDVRRELYEFEGREAGLALGLTGRDLLGLAATLKRGWESFIVQGITGREAAAAAKDSLDYGAKVVAGVTPGKGGTQIYGVPVFDTVRAALAAHPAEVSVIAVPAPAAREAAMEALENGIRLAILLKERIPRRDIVAVLTRARELGVRVIGPNCLGVISPGRTRAGIVGGRAADIGKAYRQGPVGVMSRSGGMTTEIANLLTQHGIGQSTCVSVGGDPIVGSTFVDLLPLFERDSETRAVVLFGEPGGGAEETLAEYVALHQPRLPVVAFVGGRFADEMPGVRFGHAGTIVQGERGSTRGKIAALRQAGVRVAEDFSDIVPLVRQGLGGGG